MMITGIILLYKNILPLRLMKWKQIVWRTLSFQTSSAQSAYTVLYYRIQILYSTYNPNKTALYTLIIGSRNMVLIKQHKQITLAHWVKRLRDFHSIDAQFCIFSHENPNQSGKNIGKKCFLLLFYNYFLVSPNFLETSINYYQAAFLVFIV